VRRTLSALATLALAFSLTPAVALANHNQGNGNDGNQDNGDVDTQCGNPFTPIYEIQGSGSSSPLHFSFPTPQAVVTTEGVVTVDVQRTDQHRGFFMQDVDGDGDPATSDGIFVFHQDTWGFDVSAGDVIRIEAEVDEAFGMTQLENVSDVVVCGQKPPRPLNIKPRDFNVNPEQYEGMYLKYTGNYFLTDNFNLHTFGEIWLADDGAVETPTNEFPGGSAAMHAMALDGIAQAFLLDDGSRFSNPNPVPFVHSNGTLRIGDKTNNPTGAIQYSFGNYKLIPDHEVVFKETNKRSGPPSVGGDLTVVSFNVLNYWTTTECTPQSACRGAWNGAQLEAQTDKLVAAISDMDPDIVGLQEMQNDCTFPDASTCDPTHIPVTTLVTALNLDAGSDVWSWVGPASHYNIYPINNEIIYRNDRGITTVGPSVALADPAFDDFRAGGDTPDNQLGRPPVAQTFSYGGEVFTFVVNHFKSKSTTGASGGDLDQGDGQSGHNARRVLQADALLVFVADLVTSTGDPDVLVVGDYNAYLKEDPILRLETGLVNLSSLYDADPYSYNFFATFAAPFIGRGSLDHVMGTASMSAQVGNAATWHINADEPRFLDWFDPSRLAPGGFRSSDHDPILVGVTLD